MPFQPEHCLGNAVLPRTSSLEAHDAQEPCTGDVNFDYLARCHLIPPLYPYQFVSNLDDHVNILLLHKVFLDVASIDNRCLIHSLLWWFPNADFATPALSLHLPGGSWHSKQELSLLSIDSLIYLFFWCVHEFLSFPQWFITHYCV